MTFALIPACGLSTRMGRPKLTLTLGGETVLQRVIDALCRAEVRSIVVVVGPQGSEVASIAEAHGAEVVTAADQTADMRATVELGLSYLENHFQPRPEDSWLLVPGDHPLLQPAVVEQLLQARSANPSHSIIVPTFGGKRGHPTLVDWRHVPGIRALKAGLGLNAYFRQQHAEILELAVDEPGILFDLDTPEDYERLVSGEWSVVSGEW